MYPNPPDFTTASDTDAWVLVGYPSQDGSGASATAYCYTGGRAFVDSLQSMLGVGVDGRWGATTSAALANALRSIASQTLIYGVQQDAASRRVGISSLKAAAFYMISSGAYGGPVPSGITEDHVSVHPSAVPPGWNVAAPPGPSGDVALTCVAIGDQQPQAPDQPQSPAPGPSDQSGFGPQTQSQPSDQSAVVQPAPGGPNYPAVVPPQQDIIAAPHGSSPILVFGIFAAAAAAVGYFAYRAVRGGSKGTPPPLKPPPTLRTSRPRPATLNPRRKRRAA